MSLATLSRRREYPIREKKGGGGGVAREGTKEKYGVMAYLEQNSSRV